MVLEVFFAMARPENVFYPMKLMWPGRIVLKLWVLLTVAVDEHPLILVQNLGDTIAYIVYPL